MVKTTWTLKQFRWRGDSRRRSSEAPRLALGQCPVSVRPASGQPGPIEGQGRELSLSPHSLPPWSVPGAGGSRTRGRAAVSAAEEGHPKTQRPGPLVDSPSSGTPAANCRPCPSAHPGVETPTPLWRRFPEQRRRPRRAGAQPSAGLRGTPG